MFSDFNHLRSRCRPLVLAMMAILATIILPSTPASASSTDLLVPIPTLATERGVAVVPGVPPSKTAAHVSGTVFLGWVHHSPSLIDDVIVAEWGIAERKILTRRTIRKCKPSASCAVRLKQSGDHVMALIGGYGHSNEDLEIISLGLDLTEKKSRTLGIGASPILDADGRFILAGAWETRPPVMAPIQIDDDMRIQHTEVLSLRVLDPSTLQTVGWRVFNGSTGELLNPNFIGLRASRVARLIPGSPGSPGSAAPTAPSPHNGAWVALPDHELHVLHVEIPSLRTILDQSFPRKWDGHREDATATVEPVGRDRVLVVGGHYRLLSKSTGPLTTVAESYSRNSNQYAYDAAGNVFCTEADAPSNIAGIPVRPNVIPAGGSVDGSTIAWAFGRRVLVGIPENDDASTPPNPGWGIAVLP